TQDKKQVVADNENYSELVSNLGSQNKTKFNNVFTEGTSWFKEQYLIQHLNSKDHQKAQEIETCIQLTINK
ncbi:2969_t:CDS:2, partial [Racocetra fulgida]